MFDASAAVLEDDPREFVVEDYPDVLSRNQQRAESALELRFQQLARLQADWDSYGAPPIESSALKRAFDVSAILLQGVQGLEVPVVTPTSTGGVEVEWEVGEESASLEFRPGGLISAFFDVGGDERELDHVFDFTPFLDALHRLYSRR